jgi:hypothetical protein
VIVRVRWLSRDLEMSGYIRPDLVEDVLWARKVEAIRTDVVQAARSRLLDPSFHEEAKVQAVDEFDGSTKLKLLLAFLNESERNGWYDGVDNPVAGCTFE